MVVPATARGFSLIELMVTIAVMLLLLLVGAPFAAGWGNSASVQQSKSQLMQGMAQLKATALRNTNAVLISDTATPSAVLVSTGTQLCVYSGAPANPGCDPAAAGFSWGAAISAALTLNDATLQCIAMNNIGIPMPLAIGSITCGTSMNYQLTRGSEHDSGTLN